MSTEKMNNTTMCTMDGYKEKDAEEVQIPVPWGIVSGKWWGPRGIQPILALHGRQDNAGSFDVLIPLLSDSTSVLCLDMPGHGSSSHYPKSQFYHVHWDGVILLRRIVKHFKWNKVKLLGHSLGGVIGFLYAAVFPDEVDLLISLDIASPNVTDVKKVAESTSENIDKFLKYETLPPDSLPTYEYEDMLNIVEQAYGGSITREAAEILMKRGMQPASPPGLYRFSRDPRLKVSFLGMMSRELIMIYAGRIKCAYLNIRALPGLKFDDNSISDYKRVVDKIKEGARKFEYHEVPGTHHVHLVQPEKIASIINNFLST